MTTITLPRAVVEQALEALKYAQQDRECPSTTRQAIAALRAALTQQAEPAQEPVAWWWAGDPSTQDYASTQPDPVAWRWGYRSVTTGEMDWRGYVEIAAHPNLRSPEIIIEPLYTAPPQREPLPLKTVEKLIYENTKISPNVADDRELLGYIVNAVRAVERAHGIKE